MNKLYMNMSKDNCECKECDCCDGPSNMDKWRYTLYTTILFLIIVNPMTYKLVNGLLGSIFGSIADSKGCPSMMGILVHATVFTLLLRYMMDLDI